MTLDEAIAEVKAVYADDKQWTMATAGAKSVIFAAVLSDGLVPAKRAEAEAALAKAEGQTLQELDVKPGDVVRDIADDEIGVIGNDMVWHGKSGGKMTVANSTEKRWVIVSRATAPAADAALAAVAGTGAACEAVVKTLAALKDERRFQAALAALTGLSASLAKVALRAGETQAQADARWCCDHADALLAALEARQ